MPRTVDHIVATHQIAQERRNAGLPVWDKRLDVSDVFHNDSLTFEQRRDAIVARIRSSRWYKHRVDEVGDYFYELIDELADASVDEFNDICDAVYDEADYDRVWIKTS